MATEDRSPPPPRRAVLVVDDDDDVRDMLQQILRMEGFVARGASNGLEALEALRANPAMGIVLLDLTMPRMNGRQFLEVRGADARISRVPVVIVSAADEEDEAQTLARQENVVAYLRKPVDFDTLFSYCRAHC